MRHEPHLTDWWTGLQPAEIVVRCGGRGHRIRWERGRLIARDHGDPEDERALSALASERCACLELLDAWTRHEDDLRALTRAPRDISDPVRSSAWVSSPGARGGHTPMAPGAGAGLPIPSEPRTGRFPVYPRSWDEGEAELIALLGLGGGIAERLVATVAATWAERLRPGANVVPVAVPRLRSALHARLLATVRGWLDEPALSLTLELVGEDDPRSLSRAGGRIRAELPFAWLAEVWARGLQLVDGRFCLSAETGDGDIWELTTVAPDLHTVQRVTLDAIGLPA
jgi:hypothetical protein